MSRKVLVMMVALALVAFMVTPSFAGGKMGFGGKAGLNFAKVHGDDSEGAKNRTGFTLGMYADMPLSPSFSFHPEVLYWQSGAKAEESGFTATIKLDYIQVPVLMYFRVPAKGESKMTPMFYAGPSFGIKASAKVKGEVDGASAEASIDNAKSMDVGVCFGGGGEIAMGSNKLTIDVRYTLGLTQLFDDVTDPGDNDFVIDDEGTAPKVKNGVISILVGFGI